MSALSLAHLLLLSPRQAPPASGSAHARPHGHDLRSLTSGPRIPGAPASKAALWTPLISDRRPHVTAAPPRARTSRKAAHGVPPRKTAATVAPFGAPVHARPLPRLTSLAHIAIRPRSKLSPTRPRRCPPAEPLTPPDSPRGGRPACSYTNDRDRAFWTPPPHASCLEYFAHP